MSSKVKAAVNMKTETFRLPTEKESLEKRVQRAMAKRSPMLTIMSDSVAGDSLHLKNHPIPEEAAKEFPLDWKCRYVDYFYPYAKTLEGKIAPMYLDVPTNSFDVEKCKRKKEAMRKAGTRYTYIETGASEMDVRMILEN